MIHYEPGTDGIEAFIATATALTLAGIAATAGASVTSGYMAQHGAREAANAQTEAANHAADIQSKSAAEALAFQKQQAAQDLVTHNATAKANYDQWASRERRISSLGAALGLAPRDIPDFVPTPGPTDAPASSGQTAPKPGAPGGPPSSGDPIMDALVSNYHDLGVQPTGPGSGPTDIAYMAGKIQQTGGLTPENVKYWLGPQGRIAAELAKAKGGTSGGSTLPSNLTQAAQFQPSSPALLTPALQARMGSLTSYAQGGA